MLYISLAFLLEKGKQAKDRTFLFEKRKVGKRKTNILRIIGLWWRFVLYISLAFLLEKGKRAKDRTFLFKKRKVGKRKTNILRKQDAGQNIWDEKEKLMSCKLF